MNWNLYLDDVRVPPGPGWKQAYSVTEAQKLIRELGPPTNASLDHDLGVHYCRVCAFRTAGDEPCFGPKDLCECACHAPLPSGMDLLKWMDAMGFWPINKPTVHSMNPIGKLNMEQFIDDMGPYDMYDP